MTKLRIALVVGETSGDTLGADLARQLKQYYGSDNIELIGIAGEKMQAEGVHSLADMDTLSIIGFDGLFQGLSKILRIRRELIAYFIENPPNIYIGIDAPDFNLTVEEQLRLNDIKTVHYVSPTVWAWRSYRIKKIKRAVDLMLTLFPFEVDFYNKHDVPAKFVGHPLAQELSPQATDIEFKGRYIMGDQRLVAVLPGSRNSEVQKLAPLFLQTMREVVKHNNSVRFVVPMVNERLKNKFKQHMNDTDSKFITVITGDSHKAMLAAELILLASGTAALEAALLARPMIVAYKLGWLTYGFARATTTVKYASMPNHLTEKPVVPEFLQSKANVKNLSKEVLNWLNDSAICQETSQVLAKIHPQLALPSSQLALEAIVELIDDSAQEGSATS